MDAAELRNYIQQWSAAQFGKEYADDIANIFTYIRKYNRRKPEMLDENTYSLNYNECERMVDENYDLLTKAEAINNKLPDESKDASYNWYCIR